ncbi:MAG TPA: hypothetical protein VFR80_00075 [Pyrinomonadaceae bacterium]|nr:hypothetical protein [Pyrinomonadaceae bacterium]
MRGKTLPREAAQAVYEDPVPLKQTSVKGEIREFLSRLVVTGYTAAGSGTIRLEGKMSELVGLEPKLK